MSDADPSHTDDPHTAPDAAEPAGDAPPDSSAPDPSAPDASAEGANPQGEFVIDDDFDPAEFMDGLDGLAAGEDAPVPVGADDPQARVAELSDALLHARADLVNQTRRAVKDVQTAREQTTMSLARNLMPVMDTFDLTLMQDPEKLDAATLFEGVRLVRQQLLGALAGFGLEPITAEPGDTFDPNRHTALMKQPGDGVESGCIVTVLQAGYAVNGKPVRPAQVAVAE